MTQARVYEYGLLDPTTNAELVDDQLIKAHRYRNLLTEIERDRREAVAKIMTGHTDTEQLAAEVVRLSEERDRLRVGIAKARSTTRKRSETPEMRQAVKDATERLKTARQALKDAKAHILHDPAIQQKLAAAEEASRVRRKAARAVCGVYWGSYLRAEAAADQARKEKTPPHFKPYRGEGGLSVQLQGGIDVSELWGTDSQIQIRPVPLAAHDPHTRRGERRRLCRTVLRMRVQSDDKGKPIWAEWPMILHRPLPEKCRIKNVLVSRVIRNHHQWSWRVALQLELADTWTRGQCGTGAVALNLGFTGAYPHLDGGVRSGFLVGEDGETFEASVHKNVAERVDKAASIRGFRDDAVNAMRPVLSAWLHVNKEKLPEWLAKRTTYLSSWKSPFAFMTLARQWKANRFEGDTEGYDALEGWRYREDHLYAYESGMYKTALGDRTEKYRILAAKVSTRYGTLVIGSTDLRQFQKLPEIEADTGFSPDVVRKNLRNACGSVLRQTFINAFKRAGGRVVVLEDDYATAICNACGNGEDWNRFAREHTCSHCGVTWDQDENYCKNMLARYREIERERAAGIQPIKADAPKKESRSQRLHKNRKPAAAKVEAA